MNWKTVVIGVLLATGTAGKAEKRGTAYPFFPFCIDWHNAQKRTFNQQAVMLKELGYDGVGHIWLDNVQRVSAIKIARRPRPEALPDLDEHERRTGQRAL